MAEFSFKSDMKLATATLAAIDAATLRDADNGFRPHLGASLIGRSCERQLYYTFHWVKASSFEPRMLRLFARGQREEDVFVDLLRKAGVTVHQVDPTTGRQFSFASFGGHFGGSMDGACVGLPDAPKTWHVVEMKTHGKKSFDVLARDGVRKAKPEHWFQMQCYMKWTGMTRALYMAVCKDDDRLHLERIDFDEAETDKVFAKAERIINAQEPPMRISNDASWFECKWCDYRDICHGTDAPAVNCRTCAHSTAEKAGHWSCARNGNNEVPIQIQRTGCDSHRYIPKMLHWAEMVDGNDAENWVKYQTATGTFTNGAPPDGLSSAEIHACQDKASLPGSLSDDYIKHMRHSFGAVIVG